MYDKYQPFVKITSEINLEFKPERYELWKVSGSKESNTNIKINVIKDINNNKYLVKISPNEIGISESLEFDICYTSGDRIYFATVPLDTNINTSDAFNSFKSNVPLGFDIITRPFKNFNIDEPYVMSIFTINKALAKISFSFENDPRLLEFYSHGVRE